MTIPLAAAAVGPVVNGTIGFLVIAGLGLVLVFLFRSMNKHLRKVNDAATDQRQPPGSRAGEPEGPDTGP